MAFQKLMIFTFICIFSCLLYAFYIFLHQRQRKRLINTSGTVDRIRRRGSESSDEGVAGDDHVVDIEIGREVEFAGNYPHSVISTLPEFKYTNYQESKCGEEGRIETPAKVIECAICLGTVKEGDSVRLMPNCLHMFHVECIDMWLLSHSNCPICRSEAEMTPMGESSMGESPMGESPMPEMLASNVAVAR